MNEIVLKSAVELAQMIRDRKVSAIEVLEAHLAQIARCNPKLNAICTLDEVNARIRAKQADEALSKGENWGELHGVPVTVKDIFETAGIRTTAGYIPLKDYVPQEDAMVVSRLKAAGAILLGKTNPAELAADYQSINSLFPRVNNPWNLDYTSGGSSGGSAAAIATGLSPLDLGNDFGGSIRQPAHFCMRVAAYNTVYAQPQDRYNIKRSLALIARSATQGDKKLRQLGDFSRCLPELLNPSLKGYFETLTERDRFITQLDLDLEPWDVWLVPVAATAAFTHRPAWSAVGIDGRSYPYGVANGAYTMPFNVSGHPAIVIPIGQTQDGLPIGMQIVGKRWREMELIAIAQQLDRILGAFQHPPISQ